uniref:Uncharacterized protein n=1 Tax=Arundo donax TaxID=35708 RepID=A0A0A9GZ94_ARUDO
MHALRAEGIRAFARGGARDGGCRAQWCVGEQ